MKEATSSVDVNDFLEEETTLTDRSVKDCWALYLDQARSHTSLTPVELCAMMQSLVDARDGLSIIDDNYYQIVSDSLVGRYFDLVQIAEGRNITDYPKMGRK